METVHYDRFSVEPVLDLSAAFRMRSIRNEVASFMTHNAEHIGWWQQLRWFYKTYMPARRKQAFFGLLVVLPATRECPKEYAGYGIISRRKGRWWLTGGIREKWQGQGLGRALFATMVHHVHTAFGEGVWLDVRADNHKAVALYASLGFEQYGEEKGGIIEMRIPLLPEA